MRLPLWFTLIALILGELCAGDFIMCYSCMSVNYRPLVVSRNENYQEAEDNLTTVKHLLKKIGLSPPSTSIGCADMSLTVQPSFLYAKRSICSSGHQEKCAKITFEHEGNKIVARDCFSSLFSRFRTKHSIEKKERVDLRAGTIGSLRNITIFTCSHSLCNFSSGLSLFILFLTIIVRVL